MLVLFVVEYFSMSTSVVLQQALCRLDQTNMFCQSVKVRQARVWLKSGSKMRDLTRALET